MDYVSGNPYDGLSYDEKILNDKMGFAFSRPGYNPSPPLSVEQRIRDKLLEQQIRDQIRKELDVAPKKAVYDSEPVNHHSTKSGDNIEGMSGNLCRCGRSTCAKNTQCQCGGGCPQAGGCKCAGCSGCKCAECTGDHPSKNVNSSSRAFIEYCLDNRLFILIVVLFFVVSIAQYYQNQMTSEQLTKLMAAMSTTKGAPMNVATPTASTPTTTAPAV